MGTNDDEREQRYRALLVRLQRREEAAMRELHSLVGRRIVAFAMNRLGDDDMAQTVMIDTLYEIWSHPDRFRGESRFETWVLGIAKYKVLNQLRGTRRDFDDIADYEDRLEDAGPTPPAQLEAADRADIIRKCLDKLSAVQRECMHLVYYEGMDVAEVADVQGAPSGTIKTRLMHGRKNMRTCLERHGVEVEND